MFYRTSVITIGIAIIFSVCNYLARGDSIGTTYPNTPLPRNTPSEDQTVRQIQVGKRTLLIPRNYIWMAEETAAHSLTGPTIKVLLPDFSPLTPANRHCFTNYRDRCFQDIVTFGLLNEQPPTTTAQQLQNLQAGSGLINPEPVTGPCSTVLYTPKRQMKTSNIVFEYLLKIVNHDIDPTLLRCAQDTIPHPLCNGYATVNGVSYFYNFSRSYLCEWDAIRTQIDALVTSFERSE